MDTDVLVVGAGPAGLVLAAVLVEHGVSVQIVDAKTGPASGSRAAIIHIRTLELLASLGIADRIVAAGTALARVELFERGRRVGGFPLADRGGGPFLTPVGLAQNRTEELLVAWLAERGQQVEWNTRLESLNGVTATLRHERGTRDVTARWVVGADGARSSVRSAIGADFAGVTYDQIGLLADVELTGAVPPPDALRLNLTKGGFCGVFRLGPDRWRLFGALPPELVPPSDPGPASHEPYGTVTRADIQRWFDTYFTIDAQLRTVAWTALFRIHSRLAERFRVGDVFLVGDAAHIHSPAGGQGLNLAIGDAVNLGWKLAFVATGLAEPDLLVTYESERRPVAAAVLRGADRGFAAETLRNPIATWLRGHVATRLLGPLSRLGFVRRLVFRLFSQTWIGYQDSPAVAPSTGGDGPKPGERLPYDPAVTGHLTGMRHHAVLIGNRDPVVELDRYPIDRIEVPAAYGLLGPRLLLVRPDGHVAYAGPPNDPRLTAHLRRWYRSES